MKNIIPVLIILSIFSCQPNKQKETAVQSVQNKDTVIGTLKFIGAVDSLGNEVDYYSGENTYVTMLRNGIMIECGYRKHFPDTLSTPPTCDDLLKVYNESFFNLAEYTWDGKIFRYTYTQSTHPDEVGKSYEATIEITDDLVVATFGKTKFRYKKVK